MVLQRTIVVSPAAVNKGNWQQSKAGKQQTEKVERASAEPDRPEGATTSSARPLDEHLGSRTLRKSVCRAMATTLIFQGARTHELHELKGVCLDNCDKKGPTRRTWLAHVILLCAVVVVDFSVVEEI